jgi:hypothetical protein
MSRKCWWFNRFLSIPLTMLMMTTLPADNNNPVAKPADQSVVATVEWSRLAEAKQLPKAGSIEKDGETSVLKIVRGPQDPQVVPLVTLEKPQLKEHSYRIKGKVKFEGVTGEGFLEMWSHFPDPKPGAFFSRTMAENGPMGKLRGTSPWREFTLPFFIDDKTYPMPSKLQLNVFLPDKGTVWLTDLELEEKPIDLMRKEMLGAASGSWYRIAIFGTIALSLAAAFVVAIIILAMINRGRNPQKVDAPKELLRMRALDIGS